MTTMAKFEASMFEAIWNGNGTGVSQAELLTKLGEAKSIGDQNAILRAEGELASRGQTNPVNQTIVANLVSRYSYLFEDLTHETYDEDPYEDNEDDYDEYDYDDEDDDF